MHVTPFSAATILVFAIASPFVTRRASRSLADSPPIRLRSESSRAVSNSMYPVIPIHSHRAPRRTANRTAPLPGLPAAPA